MHGFLWCKIDEAAVAHVALCRQRCELLSMNQQWSEAEDMCGSVIESDKELDVDWFDGGCRQYAEPGMPPFSVDVKIVPVSEAMKNSSPGWNDVGALKTTS